MIYCRPHMWMTASAPTPTPTSTLPLTAPLTVAPISDSGGSAIGPLVATHAYATNGWPIVVNGFAGTCVVGAAVLVIAHRTGIPSTSQKAEALDSPAGA